MTKPFSVDTFTGLNELRGIDTCSDNTGNVSAATTIQP